MQESHHMPGITIFTVLRGAEDSTDAIRKYLCWLGRSSILNKRISMETRAQLMGDLFCH